MKRLLRRRSDRKKSRRAVVAGEAAAAAASAAHTPESAAPVGVSRRPAEHTATIQVPRREPRESTVAAFFDVDNTIMRGSSIYHLARGMSARDLFTTHDLVRFAWKQLWFRFGGTENTQHMRGASEAALAFVAGQQVERLVGLSQQIYDELIADRVWPGTRALAQQHLEAGQRVWLVTATPVELADTIAQRLRLTGALGTVAESVEGVYTGRLVGELLHGPAKAEAVRALAQRESLSLERCSAYSDSINDLPMLSLVGHPYAINPDPDLYEYAKERGWPILDFRTGRKATLIALPVAAGVGALAGGIAVGIWLRHRYKCR